MQWRTTASQSNAENHSFRDTVAKFGSQCNSQHVVPFSAAIPPIQYHRFQSLPPRSMRRQPANSQYWSASIAVTEITATDWFLLLIDCCRLEIGFALKLGFGFAVMIFWVRKVRIYDFCFDAIFSHECICFKHRKWQLQQRTGLSLPYIALF